MSFNIVTRNLKAINNTTVEVTFEDAVDDVKALDFAIEGLQITNAAIKQTDNKTVVLTTSAQTADVEYTVTVDGEAIGKFKGISAVIPTAIKVTTPSVQGTIGKEVTVSAEVTVPEGQSKAGIPVTFNIVSNTNSNVNGKIEVVAYTNDKGVASYSYTRYYKHNDSVAAYATDKSSVVSNGTVYWADSLAIKEVTTGNTFANGSKKVYEITGAAGETVNITFKENVQVDPSKLVRTVDIKDVTVETLNTSTGAVSPTTASYPYEVTTGGVQIAHITLDREGKATFTVEGSNATVTPVVFKDGAYTDSTKTKWSGNGKLGAQELQAAAAPVTFSLQHTLALDVEAKGSANAAADISGTVANVDDVNSGGRTYEVTVRTNDGKLAPETTPAYVTFEEGTLSPDKAVYINGVLAKEGQVYTIAVKGKEGKASFRLTGAKDAFAQPTVFLNNGTSTDLKLDKSDLKVVSAQTFFVDAVVKTATLKAKAEGITKDNKVVVGNQTTFTYQSTDQNGFPYYEGTNYNVTFQLSTTFGNLSNVFLNGQALGTTRSLTVPTVNGAASITIDTDRATDIVVTASANNRTLPILTTSVEYVAGLAALAAVNDADNAKEVLAALLLDNTFRAKLLSLPVANQEAIAAAIYAGLPAVNGYSEAGLKAAFNREYALQETAVQTAAITALVTKASTAVLTVADLETVPGLDLTELKALPASNQLTVVAAIDTSLAGTPVTTITALQSVVDAAVVAEKLAMGGVAIQAKVDAIIGATTVAAFDTAVAALNDSAINGFLLTAEYSKFNNRQKQDVLNAVNALTAGTSTLTDLQLAVKNGAATGKTNATFNNITGITLAGTSLTISFSESIEYANADTPALSDLGLSFDVGSIAAASAAVVNDNGSTTYEIVITLAPGSTVAAGSTLNGITVKDAFGDVIDLSKVTPVTNLDVQ